MDNVSYAKTVGYGAPEKTGGPNTLYMYGKPDENDTEGIYRSTDAGKTWVCINTQHLYGGTGNGNYLVGDMNEFGKVYMSTVGCGIICGWVDDGIGGSIVTSKTSKTTTTTTTTTTVSGTTGKSDKSGSSTSKTTTTTSKSSGGENGSGIKGDVNDDGVVDVRDAVLMARYVGGDTTAFISENGMKQADVDGKKGVSATDLTKLLRVLAHLESF
jgi:hypothetical protein